MAKSRYQNRAEFANFSTSVSTCSVYFVIDGSKEMFEKNPKTNETYFDECIKAYHDVLVQKCLWNSDDMMGLMIFGTNRDNSDPYIENVWVLQELKKVDMQMAKQINSYLKSEIDLTSVKQYPILDAIRHATNKISSVTKAMIFKRIIFFTRNDNPFEGDSKTRHNIRVRAKNMNEMDIEFEIMGLGDAWNDELFWKDIRLIFNDKPQLLKSISQMKFDIQKPARVFRETKLIFWNSNEANRAGISVVIYNIVKRMKYLTATKVDAATNKEVDSIVTYKKDESDVEDEEEDDLEKYVHRDNVIFKSAKYGGKIANFSWQERSHLKNTIKSKQPTGIRIIDFYDIQTNIDFHLSTPYFVTWSKTATPEEKMYFAALLSHCDDLKVMAFCSAKLLIDPKLYYLIPCKEKGGFYFYQIPFSDQVRRYQEWEIFQETKQNEFVDPDRVFILNKMINANKVQLSDCRYKNPKLQKQLSIIRTLALEEENPIIFNDDTEPDVKKMKERVGNLIDTYTALYPQAAISTGSRGTKRTYDAVDKESVTKELEEKVSNNSLHGCTVDRLKDYCTALRISKTGKKAELIARITTTYKNK